MKIKAVIARYNEPVDWIEHKISNLVMWVRSPPEVQSFNTEQMLKARHIRM